MCIFKVFFKMQLNRCFIKKNLRKGIVICLIPFWLAYCSLDMACIECVLLLVLNSFGWKATLNNTWLHQNTKVRNVHVSLSRKCWKVRKLNISIAYPLGKVISITLLKMKLYWFFFFLTYTLKCQFYLDLKCIFKTW